MKKLPLFTALLAVLASSAYAADPSAISPKAHALKEKVKPAIINKIKKDMAPVKPKEESEEHAPETPVYTMEAGEITFTENNENCTLNWTLPFKNTGSAIEHDTIAYPVVVNRPLANGDASENEKPTHTFTRFEAGEEDVMDGVLLRHTSRAEKLVVTLKDGDTVLATQEAAIPGDHPYTMALGELEVADGQISIPVTVNSDAPLGGMLVVVQAIRSVDPMNSFFIVGNIDRYCVPANEPQTLNIAVPEEAHVGYRVMVYRAGENTPAVQRDYIL